MKRGVCVTLVALLLAVPASPPGAVVILDSTWTAEGGAPGREADGFAAHERLAAEPQFRAVLALDPADGSDTGIGSGTWIGNADGHGYVLTAAHNFDDAEPRDLIFRTDGGLRRRGERVWIHPEYVKEGECTGVDLAIVRLERPMTGMGEPPLLYAGDSERGNTITFVGYGTRGIASVGENAVYNRGTAKAAAEGIVEERFPLRPDAPSCEAAGNYLGIFLPREDGRIANPLGGSNRPVSRLAGLLGAGDSGGSAWMRLGGAWVVVGVNVSGDGEAQYGDQSWFARVSGARSWIESLVPGVRFTGGGEPVAAAPARPTARPGDSACALGARHYVLSEGAWFPARAHRPGRRPGTCVVRFDGYGADEDETVGRGRMLAWDPAGPGQPVEGCERGLEVLAEEDGVWYPAVITRDTAKGCRVAYEDPDYEDETVPPSRLRTLR